MATFGPNVINLSRDKLEPGDRGASAVGFINVDLVEAACVQIPVQRDAIGADGLIGDPAIQNAIAAALNTLVEYVQRIAEKASS